MALLYLCVDIKGSTVAGDAREIPEDVADDYYVATKG